MIPLRAFALRGLPKTSIAPYSEPPGGVRRWLSVTARLAPAARLNDDDVAATYLLSETFRFAWTTPVVRFWAHGRTRTVTFSVSLVVFLTVTDPSLPLRAVCSTVSGVSDTPPAAAFAWGAASSACAITPPDASPAAARATAPARCRLLPSFTP